MIWWLVVIVVAVVFTFLMWHSGHRWSVRGVLLR